MRHPATQTRVPSFNSPLSFNSLLWKVGLVAASSLCVANLSPAQTTTTPLLTAFNAEALPSPTYGGGTSYEWARNVVSNGSVGSAPERTGNNPVAPKRSIIRNILWSGPPTHPNWATRLAGTRVITPDPSISAASFNPVVPQVAPIAMRFNVDDEQTTKVRAKTAKLRLPRFRRKHSRPVQNDELLASARPLALPPPVPQSKVPLTMPPVREEPVQMTQATLQDAPSSVEGSKPSQPALLSRLWQSMHSSPTEEMTLAFEQTSAEPRVPPSLYANPVPRHDSVEDAPAVDADEPASSSRNAPQRHSRATARLRQLACTVLRAGCRNINQRGTNADSQSAIGN